MTGAELILSSSFRRKMMPSPQQRFHPIRQFSSYLIAIILSVAVTLAVLQIFPSVFLPKSYAASDATLLQAQVQSPQPERSQLTNSATSQSAVPRSFVAAAVGRVGPAVVRIDTERVVTRNLPDPFFDDPFFRRFFGNDALPQMPREFRQRGQGSGFIVDRSGIILTNAHVVSGADTVSVLLKDGRTFQGEVRGADDTLDLAVIQIDGDNLPVAPLGSSENVQVGDWAIAVGNPLGLDNTVTLGIVSTLNRSSSQVGVPDKRIDFIQTDAAINPGNSGGPLLNDEGEVIGINTAIRADAEGIGFAIPIDTAKAVQDQLARGENIPHPFIGIRMVTLTPDIAKEINRDPNSVITVPEVSGVLVVEVMPDSPAAVGGLRRGDVVTRIAANSITSAEQLQRQVERSDIGQPLQFTIQRGDRTQQLSIRPGELQNMAQQR
jgi:S1-C subfamily serine protease